MDIRLLTCVIIRKNGEYLVGRIIGTNDLRWSNSPYDARRTRNRDNAQNMAQETGGKMMLFNPAVGQLRAL